MGCLKCGKKTADEQSFCPACLEAMEAYPVKSDTPILLPNREKDAAARKTGRKRRPASPEEQAALLRKKVRWLTALSVLLLILLAAGVALLVQSWLAAGEIPLPKLPLFHVKQLMG